MSSSGSNPQSSKPTDKSSNPPAKPEKPAKASWRGKAQPGAEGPRYRWQADKNQGQDSAILQKKFSHRVKVAGFIVLSLALIVAFVYKLIDWSPKTPFFAIALTRYPSPVSLNAWAVEDVQSMNSLHGHSLFFENLSESWTSWQLAKETLDRKFRDAKKKTDASHVVVVYLSVHGISDESGTPCLLLPNSDPLNSQSWIPLSEVLSCFKSPDLPSTVRKLLILDSSRMTSNWHLGVLYNTFSDHLKKLIEDMVTQDDIPGLVVLNSAGPGEMGWSSPELGHSVFGHYLFEGLRGEADQVKEGGDSNQEVSLHELYHYLKHHVAEWARQNRADVQMPMLIPATTADFRVASASKSKKTTSNTADSAEGASGMETDLAQLWENLSKIPADQLYRFEPVEWQYLAQQILRLEQMTQAGSAYHSDATKLLTDLKARVAELQQSRASPPMVPAHSLPLARQFQRFEETKDTRDKLQAEYGAAGNAFKSEKPFSYLAKSEAAWSRMLKNPSLDEAASAVNFIGLPEPGIDPGVIEGHFLNMLHRYLDANSRAEQLREFIELAVVTRANAETAAAPDDERAQYWVRGPVDRGDEARRRADDGLFIAETRQLQDSRREWQQANEQYDEAIRRAKPVQKALERRDQAWAELPFLAHWLTRNLPLSQSADQTHEWDSKINKSLLPLIHNTHELAHGLDIVLDSMDHDPAEFSNAFNQVEEGLNDLEGQFRAECSRLLNSVEYASAFREIAAVLEVPVPLMTGAERKDLRDGYRTIVQTLHKKYSPTPAGPSDRAKQGTAATSDKDTSEHDTPGAKRLGRVAIYWDDHPALAILNRDKLPGGRTSKKEDRPSLTEESDTRDMLRTVDRSGDIVRERLRSVGSASAKWLETSDDELTTKEEGRDTTLQARMSRSAADRLVRAASALLAAPPETDANRNPNLRLRRLDWHNLLTWHCRRTLDDFWGSTDPIAHPDNAFFAKAAANYLDSAMVLGKSPGGSPPAQDDLLLKHLRERKKAAEEWITLQSDIIETGEEEDTPDIRHSIDGTPDEKLPPGMVAIFLRGQNGAIPLREPDPRGTIQRLMISAKPAAGAAPRQTREFILNRSDLKAKDAAVKAVAFYRGREREQVVRVDPAGGTRLEVIPPPEPKTFVTVSGQSNVRGAVMLILDCSGSMSEQIAGGPVRFDEAKRVFRDLLNDLVEGKHYLIGVRFYGHRVRLDGGQLRKSGWKGSDGKPIPDMRPGQDVEKVMDVKLFGDTELQQVESMLNQLRPWGATPLYLSLCESLQHDFSGIDAPPGTPKSIILITDGVDDQHGFKNKAEDTELGKTRSIRTVKDVSDLMEQHPEIDVNLLGFDLPANLTVEERRKLQEFDSVTKKRSGHYYTANNANELRLAMERLIPNKYLVLRDDVALDPEGIRLDERTPVKLPTSGTKRRFEYVAKLKVDQPEVKAKLELEGGESILLFVGPKGLEHRLYQTKSPFEKFFPALRQEGLSDPVDRNRKFRLGFHPARRDGDTIRFPISIQNANEKDFSYRPAEAWVDITPVIANELKPDQTYSFYDLNYQTNPPTPVPVLECVAPKWPTDAKEASIRVSFKMGATDPGLKKRVGEAKIEKLNGVTFSVQTDQGRVKVTERHPADDLDFRSMKVELDPQTDPPARKIVHRFDQGNAVHQFFFPDVPAATLNDYELRVTTRKAMQARAVDLAEPVRVRVPGVGDAIRN